MNDLELDTFIGDNYLEIREIGHTMTPFEHEDLGNLFVAAKGRAQDQSQARGHQTKQRSNQSNSPSLGGP
jgi:hypothetical protein